MRVFITCKKCGKRRNFIWSAFRIPNFETALKEGWSSDGKDMYCRNCAGSIEEVSDQKVVERMKEILWEQLPKRD
jgi:hypothetical protein